MILKRYPWIVVVPVVLLAAWLAARNLNTDAFATDEVASMYVARGAFYDSFTPLEAWNKVAERSADQAIGLALMLSNWGQVFGWTVFGTRLLAFFAGLLALAWVYRAGRDLFSPAVGFIAVCIMAISVFFITYMHIIRIFTTVTLVTAITLWSYWRVALRPKPPGIAPQIGLLIGCVGLFYTHYFATLLLPVIGLYHLLFVPKTRRWWRVVLIMAVAALFFLPELNVFIKGYQRNASNTNLHENAMAPGESVARLVEFFSNGILPLDDNPVPGLLVLLAMAALVGFVIYRYRVFRAQNTSFIFIAFCGVGLLAAILAANEVVQVMAPRRVRYMIALWPLLSLLVAWGIWQLARLQPWLPGVALGVWMVVGITNNLSPEFYYQFDSFTRVPLHQMHPHLLQDGAASDLLVIDGLWFGNGRPRDFYTAFDIALRRKILYPSEREAIWQGSIGDSLRVWLLVQDPPGEIAPRFEPLLEDDFIHCQRSMESERLALDLYARDTVFCPAAEQPSLRFGDGVALVNSAVQMLNSETLQVDMAWRVDPDVPPQTYSVGVYVQDAASGEVMAQVDYGLPAAPYGPVRTQLNVSDISPGEYTLLTSVYDWQTVEPLPGVDLTDGTEGQALPLGAVTIE